MKKIWTRKKLSLLREKYPTADLDELAMELGVSRSGMKSCARRYGIRREVNVKHVWTDEEDAILRERYAETDTRELCRLLGMDYKKVCTRANRLGLKKTHEYKSRIYNPNGINGKSAWFKKGHVPMNKGKKQWEYLSTEAIEKCRRTTFKKGNVPHNVRPVGSECVHGDGYVYIKTDSGKIVPKHIHVWKQHNGDIPDGMLVTFIDGNKLNCDISNLRLLTRAENANIELSRRSPERKREIIEKIRKTRNNTIRMDKIRIHFGLEPKTRLVKRW